MQLRFERLRFTYTASRSFSFTVPASNKLRGAIGYRLWEREDDAYEAFFAPKAVQGPSGLGDIPRPFVLRAQHLDSVRVTEGQEFFFDLHLFDLRSEWPRVLEESLHEIGCGWLRDIERELVTVDLESEAIRVEHARVRFVTPTELKARGSVVDRPEFGVLAARVRDRVSTLMQLYSDGPLDIDFAGFGARASMIDMPRCEIEHVEWTRRSGSNGEAHPIGGFVGYADYEGDLTEFVPYLRGAVYTGIGRQTTWGKGIIALE